MSDTNHSDHTVQETGSASPAKSTIMAGHTELGQPTISAQGSIPIERTQPDKLLRHDISDEQLLALGNMRRDYLWEGKWVALGAALGSISTAYSSIHNAYFISQSIPLSGGGLAQVIVFSISLSAFILLHFIFKKKSKDAGDLVDEIQKRTRRQN